MTEPAEIAALQARLERQRETLGRLLLRITAQGGRRQAHLVFLRRLVEARAELAETKARLRALGAPVENWPDDDGWAEQDLDDRAALNTLDVAALCSRLERRRRFLALTLDFSSRDGRATPLRIMVEARAEIAQIKARLQALGAEVADHPDDGPGDEAIREAAALPSPSAPLVLSPDERAELLAGLARRYQEQWERALVPQGYILPRLRDRSDAVDPTWQGLRPYDARPAAPPTTLIEAFEAHQGQLLVLGDAGAGKSILLLELALALTRRAQADAQAPLPLLLNLASAPAQPVLAGWLLDGLPDWISIFPDQALKLASGGEVALLLDGLDEVPADQRAGWVEVISAAATACEPPLLAVACDSSVYSELGARLELDGAVELEALEPSAAEEVLGGAPAAEPLLAALRSDAPLRGLMSTPLMIHLALAAGDQAPPPERLSTLDVARASLWGAFLRRALLSPLPPPWEPRQVLHALRWLAQHLHDQGAIAFQPSALPPSLIPNAALRAVLRATELFSRQTRALLERLCEHGLLECEGRLYRFRHVLLRDWCAALSDTEIEALVGRLRTGGEPPSV